MPDKVTFLTCPFCGGEGIPSKDLRDGCLDGEPDAYAHYVRCRSCAAQGGWTKTPGNAVRLWNTRQAVQETLQGATGGEPLLSGGEDEEEVLGARGGVQ